VRDELGEGMKRKLPKIPLGTKRAIRDAFELALHALSGQPCYIVETARTKTWVRLGKAYEKLIAEGYTHA
jgi:hypothetical protein